jgi:tryptophanyl-tRNA synthetase
MKIFSGMRPSGQLHIGNYLGALKNWLELQKKASCIFSIVDYHAITTPFEPKQIKKDIKELILDYLGAGIDPKKSLIVIQSHVLEHTELAWILETLTPVGELQRMTQFKEKSHQHKENINAGLFSYPVLMAADILLYKTDTVPVGDDQVQHVELARTLAKKFNNKFGNVFPLPKPYLQKLGARIMSLTDPSKKMSKTGDESILLNDSANDIKRKIKKAVTDSGNKIKYDEKKKPAISNLLTIYHLFSGKSISEIEKKYEKVKGPKYGQFKNDLAEVIVKALKPIQERRKKYEKSPQLIKKIITEGQTKASKIAKETMREVKAKIGLI